MALVYNTVLRLLTTACKDLPSDLGEKFSNKTQSHLR